MDTNKKLNLFISQENLIVTAIETVRYLTTLKNELKLDFRGYSILEKLEIALKDIESVEKEIRETLGKSLESSNYFY